MFSRDTCPRAPAQGRSKDFGPETAGPETIRRVWLARAFWIRPGKRALRKAKGSILHYCWEIALSPLIWCSLSSDRAGGIDPGLSATVDPRWIATTPLVGISSGIAGDKVGFHPAQGGAIIGPVTDILSLTGEVLGGVITASYRQPENPWEARCRE